jgi:hypothetical protein
MMHRLVIALFDEGDQDPLYGTIVDSAVVGVQVTHETEGPVGEVYDFRLQAPVMEHVLCEVTQLLEDLVSSSCASIGGLQPALFA